MASWCGIRSSFCHAHRALHVPNDVRNDIPRVLPSCEGKGCPLRGRRAPELACGTVDAIITGALNFAASEWLPLVAHVDKANAASWLEPLASNVQSYVIVFSWHPLADSCMNSY